jgi:hypothetical protein
MTAAPSLYLSELFITVPIKQHKYLMCLQKAGFLCGGAFLVLRSAACLYRELRREIETLFVVCDNLACVLSINVVQRTACRFQTRSADLSRNDSAGVNLCFVDC